MHRTPSNIHPDFFLSRLSRWLPLLVLTAVLGGCGGGGGSGASSAVTAPSGSPQSVTISGSVGDGPVTGATISVYSSSGELLGSMTSDSTATFRSEVKVKGNQYPLRLVVRDGIDLVTGAAPDFEMVSVMLHPSDKQVNINPFTTLIVMLAEKMRGGLSSSNIDAARPIVLEKLGFGLDPNIIADPITTEITYDKVAHLVKASEALGEMVRRTRDQMVASGKSASGDSVLGALSGDLTDGIVDGFGAGANPLVASVANVVSGQVLVEAMSNNLRVAGLIATSIIDQSIVTTRSGISSAQLTDSVAIDVGMIEQARVAVAAAQVLDSSSAVQDLAADIASLTPGSLPAEIVTILPANSSQHLDNAVNTVATADSGTVQTINQVVASDGTTDPTPDPTPVNTPPVISGSPAGAVTANMAYVFQPSASDADGDSLRFSISNKPTWAGFSATTGRLSGTPADTDVGSYGGIVISVTDGTDTTSLPAFSIAVAAAPVQNGSLSLSWVPPVTRADGSPLVLSDVGGYRIYYGIQSGNYPDMSDITDGTANGATVTGLASGTYYVVMTTYDTGGLESAYSAEVVKNVP